MNNLDKDSGALVADGSHPRRNTPVSSRGATKGETLAAKRTEKTTGRGTDLPPPSDVPHVIIQKGSLRWVKDSPPKPRKRTVGSISVPELPWLRDRDG